MNRVAGVGAPRIQQHLQRGAFRIAMLAIAGEDVVIGRHTLEEDGLHIVVAAVMRDLQEVDMPLAARFQ